MLKGPEQRIWLLRQIAQELCLDGHQVIIRYFVYPRVDDLLYENGLPDEHSDKETDSDEYMKMVDEMDVNKKHQDNNLNDDDYTKLEQWRYLQKEALKRNHNLIDPYHPILNTQPQPHKPEQSANNNTPPLKIWLAYIRDGLPENMLILTKNREKI